LTMIVDSAIYVNGQREESPSLEQIQETIRKKSGFAWIGLYEPTREELGTVAGEFGLHELAVRDSLRAHLRPKAERYGDTLFVAIKTARYVDETETVEFGEVHAFVGSNFVVTVRHGKTNELVEVRRRLESRPELLRRGPYAVLYAIMNRIVEDYVLVVNGLANDIDEIEVQVFQTDPNVSRRIYELSREVTRFHQATQPLAGTLGRLIEEESDDFDMEVQRYLRSLRDRLLRVTDESDAFRQTLQNILSVNLTLVSVNQNDQVKKISAWAAILIVPTLITGIYGMNFDFMPELHWLLGYPYSLVIMLTISLILYRRFKRLGWL
jgi:magnesium transporter